MCNRYAANEAANESTKRRSIARWTRSLLVQGLIALLVFFLIQQFVVAPMASRAAEIPYSQFKADSALG